MIKLNLGFMLLYMAAEINRNALLQTCMANLTCTWENTQLLNLLYFVMASKHLHSEWAKEPVVKLHDTFVQLKATFLSTGHCLLFQRHDYSVIHCTCSVKVLTSREAHIITSLKCMCSKCVGFFSSKNAIGTAAINS